MSGLLNREKRARNNVETIYKNRAVPLTLVLWAQRRCKSVLIYAQDASDNGTMARLDVMKLRISWWVLLGVTAWFGVSCDSNQGVDAADSAATQAVSATGKSASTRPATSQPLPPILQEIIAAEKLPPLALPVLTEAQVRSALAEWVAKRGDVEYREFRTNMNNIPAVVHGDSMVIAPFDCDIRQGTFHATFWSKAWVHNVKGRFYRDEKGVVHAAQSGFGASAAD
jgi:hypothetical protein